jgi:hypothetical protein
VRCLKMFTDFSKIPMLFLSQNPTPAISAATISTW